MTSMSYCKYENTLAALRQCAEDWTNESIQALDQYEASAKTELILLMTVLLEMEGFVIKGKGTTNLDEYTS